MIVERSSEKLECTLNPQQSSAVYGCLYTLSAIMVALCLSWLFSFPTILFHIYNSLK